MIAVVLFVIAAALRWPSCGESFWVDELHTAWCTFGDWNEVRHRASMGNQQPLYFGGLWIWQHITPSNLIDLYGIEAWLRSTSVIASAATASVVYVIVARVSRSQIGGVAAGLAMSIESSSIFYGTELRPYAWIGLAAAIAAGLAAVDPASDGFGHEHDHDQNLGLGSTRNRISPTTRRLALHGVVMVAAITHITSLITLAPLLTMVIVRDAVDTGKGRPSKIPFRNSHIGPMLIWIVAAVLFAVTHTQLWGVRDRWNAFATPQTIREVGSLWPWISLILFPLMLNRIATVRRSSGDTDQAKNLFLVMFYSVVVATTGCYLLSTIGGVPLWNRRYLFSCLPMLCIGFGLIIGAIRNGDLRVVYQSQWLHRGVAVTVMLLSLGMMSSHDGLIRKIVRGQTRLVTRGEDWRSAIDWIREHQDDLTINEVWIDPNLVEQNTSSFRVTDLIEEQYFRFVVDGPYRLPRGIGKLGTGRDATNDWVRLINETNEKTTRRTILLTRRSILNSPSNVAIEPFGRVRILHERKKVLQGD